MAESTSPVLLLPLRLETRFLGKYLLVRVFPDDIHLDVPDKGTARPAFARLMPYIFEIRVWVKGEAQPIIARGYRPNDRGWPPPDPQITPTMPGPSESHSDKIEPGKSGIEWLLRFDEAMKIGMGFKIEVGDKSQIDRIIVVGNRFGADGPALASLLESHKRRNALSFLPQTTPTNNTDTVSSGYMSPEAGITNPVQPVIEQTLKPNAARLVRALGLAEEKLTEPGQAARAFTLDNLPFAGDYEDAGANGMNTVLWPATWGYFLENMMAPMGGSPGRIDREQGRVFFQDFVRAGGPLPTLRVGRQPYGVIPVMKQGALSTEGAVAGSEFPWLGELERVLSNLRGLWRSAVGRVPAAVNSSDLLNILQTQPQSVSYVARLLLGRHYLRNLLALSRWGVQHPIKQDTTWSAPWERITPAATIKMEPGDFSITQDWASLEERNNHTVEATLKGRYVDGKISTDWNMTLTSNRMYYNAWLDDEAVRVGKALRTAWNNLPQSASPSDPGDIGSLPRVAGARFTREGFNLRYTQPLVAPDDPGTHACGEKVWLETLAGQLSTGEPLSPQDDTSLFRIVVRQAALLLRRQAAREILSGLLENNPPPRDIDLIRHLLALTETEEELVKLDVSTGQAKSPTQQLIELVATASRPLTSGTHLGLTNFVRGILNLATLDREKLQSLFAGTLDLASHRLDAWVTSLASWRLKQLRATNTGIGVGAYGWIENLSRRQTDTTPISSGFIHAPSMSHAATAAILRSAYHRPASDADRDPSTAIDLSSTRVRKALWVLDSVRQGQPMGEVLGYLFERRLIEQGSTSVSRFRSIAQLKGTLLNPGAAPEEVTLGTVTDGLVLAYRYHAFKESKPEAQAVDLTFGAMSRADVVALDELWDIVDALSDLLLAESVHQTVLGRPHAAGGTLDALANGKLPPPELDVIRTPQTGISLAHRVVWLVDPDDRPNPSYGWGSPPRLLFGENGSLGAGEANPALNALCARILGPVNRVWYAAVTSTNQRQVMSWSTFDKNPPFSPLDLVCLAVSNRDMLLKKLEVYCRALTPPAFSAVILGPEREDTRVDPSVLELVEVAATLGRLLANARLATAQDVRWSAAVPTRVESSGRRELLGGIPQLPGKFGLPAVFTPGMTRDQSDGTLRWFGSTVSAEAQKLVQRMARIRPGSKRLNDLLLYSGALDSKAGMDLQVAQLPGNIDRWMGLPVPADQDVDRAVSLILYGDPDLLKKVQNTPLKEVTGLVIDEWTEMVPRKLVSTGVSFHFDGPDACAPQALLLAVPPPDCPQWDVSSLMEVVIEALELARIRGVDPDALNVPLKNSETLNALRQFLPAITLAHMTRPDGAEPDAHMPSTDFTTLAGGT